MAIRVTVRFCPLTTAPYADALTVVTETGAFSVPLTATLPAPELTLPLTLHAGVCLPHDRIAVAIPFANSGARARFRLVPAALFERLEQGGQQEPGADEEGGLLSDGPLEAADAAAVGGPSAALPLLTDDFAVMGPLTVSPVQWELEQGGPGATLQVVFAPTAVGDFDERFVIVCSNGEVAHYNLLGESSILRVRASALPLHTHAHARTPACAAGGRDGL